MQYEEPQCDKEMLHIPNTILASIKEMNVITNQKLSEINNNSNNKNSNGTKGSKNISTEMIINNKKLNENFSA